ncbi:zinc finger protein 665-like [Stegodyphus dumicola]|uniref:zinc finger protein 665-like n=1 Tax=Stegodyphus dumicola TaxID=202533 RepID=UPI0015AFD718|nr:zinc finger protein 665-like [Stegodyphus dumicola]
MAQVLLDRANNRRSSVKELLSNTFETVGNNNLVSVLSKLRRRKETSKNNPVHHSSKDQSLTPELSRENQTIDIINLDDSRSCDDPEYTQNEEDDLPSVDIIEETKNDMKGFACTVCGHVTSSSQRLREHLSRHTGIKHLECEICGKKFAWRYSYRSHMVSHMEDNPNKCTVCGKRYCNKSAVKNHMLRIHGNPSKDFKCEKCDKRFVTEAELKRHGFNHTKEKSFVCEYCGNAYRYKGALLVHYRIHSGEKPYKCGFCDKAFIHLSSAIGHRRRHTGEMPYQCKECGKTFRVKRAMTAHMSVHNDKRQFKCNECGKGFKSRSGYRVHLDFHLGVKRHACKYCGRTFRAWCNMHKHVRRHLGEKPHKCELCGKTFIEKQELKNHMKSHKEKNQKSKNVKSAGNTCESNCAEILPPPSMTCSSASISSSNFTGTQHASEIIPHIDISDSQPVMYDCNLPSSLDKNSPEKCQLLQDNFVSQFLYSQQSSVQYSSQSSSVLNMYPSIESGQTSSNRSAFITNMNSTNFNCVSLNNQNYNTFSYGLPNSDSILSKCKLCRSLFNSILLLRSHLLDYHRIEEEHIDELMA